jgi:hypothetical protein
MVIQHLVTTLQHMSDVRLIMVLRRTVEDFPENKLRKLVMAKERNHYTYYYYITIHKLTDFAAVRRKQTHRFSLFVEVKPTH